MANVDHTQALHFHNEICEQIESAEKQLMCVRCNYTKLFERILPTVKW